MEVKAYQIRDLRVGLWRFPFPAVNDDAAVRMMIHRMIEDPTSLEARFPDDFELYVIGEMNQETGSFTELPRTFLCDFSDMLSEVRERGTREQAVSSARPQGNGRTDPVRTDPEREHPSEQAAT